MLADGVVDGFELGHFVMVCAAAMASHVQNFARRCVLAARSPQKLWICCFLGRRGVAELGLWRRWRADSGNVYVLVASRGSVQP